MNCAQLAYVTYTPILILYIPEHRCSVSGLVAAYNGTVSEEEMVDLVIPVNEEGIVDKCHMYEIVGNKVRGKISSNLISN